MSDDDRSRYYTSVAVAEAIADAAATVAMEGKQDVANMVNPLNDSLPKINIADRTTKYPSIATTYLIIKESRDSTLCGTNPDTSCATTGNCYWLCTPSSSGLIWRWRKVIVAECPDGQHYDSTTETCEQGPTAGNLNPFL